MRLKTFERGCWKLTLSRGMTVREIVVDSREAERGERPLEEKVAVVVVPQMESLSVQPRGLPAELKVALESKGSQRERRKKSSTAVWRSRGATPAHSWCAVDSSAWRENRASPKKNPRLCHNRKLIAVIFISYLPYVVHPPT